MKSQILQSALDHALLEGQGTHDLGISAAVIVPGYEPWVGVSGNSRPGIPPTRHEVLQEITRRFLDPLQLENSVISMGELPPPSYTVAHSWLDIDGD